MKCLKNINNKDMKAERKKIIAEYLRFMISGKEIKGKGYRNRPASKFYEYLRRDADLYKCSVMDVLYRDAEFVLNGVFIDLMKLDKKERINKVIDEVVSLGLDLTVENVYAQSLFSPGGTLFNCDEEVKRQIYLHEELIPNVTYIINDNKVQITSPSTSYINVTRHEKISLESILSMINEIDTIRKADKRIKIKGISTIRKRVKDAYKLYLLDWAVYDETFNKCIVLAKQIEREGLHFGTSNDTVLNELTESRFIIDRLGYGGTNYSTMLELNNSIKSVLDACRMISTDCLKMGVGL